VIVFYHEYVDDDYSDQAEYLDCQDEAHEDYEGRGDTFGGESGEGLAEGLADWDVVHDAVAGDLSDVLCDLLIVE
jgi:hypothetical protein